MTFILSRNKSKETRKVADAFAFPFVKLSNYISPTAPAARLAVEELGDGKVRALPVEQPVQERNLTVFHCRQVG